MSDDNAKRSAEALIPKFEYERVINREDAGRRLTVYGRVEAEPALLLLERGPFPDAPGYLSALPASLRGLQSLGTNDVYHWYLGSSPGPGRAGTEPGGGEQASDADLKMTLICPCTDQHIRKHSRQGYRRVTETAEIYRDRVRPLMQANRQAGRLNWVFNIIDGLKEVEDVIYRTPLGRDGDEGFLLLPNLHWDRRTIEALHLLCVVERRDIWSLRDLRKKHVGWLKHMKAKLIDAAVETYPEIEEDQLKLFVHYQPTYYHFHIHLVHVMLDATAMQAVGKAVCLDSIIEQLELMAGSEDTGMDTVSLTYTVGEESDLWVKVFEPLKRERLTQ